MDEKKGTLKEVLIGYFKSIVLAVVFTVILLQFFQLSRVVGSSMLPTYKNGNIVVVSKFIYKKTGPKYNDIVIIEVENSQYLQRKKELIIKRIVGLPGDKLQAKNGVLYRNGKALKEDYIKDYESTYNLDEEITVPENKIFVMGDNRLASTDSRLLGYIDFNKQVIGKVVFKII